MNDFDKLDKLNKIQIDLKYLAEHNFIINSKFQVRIKNLIDFDLIFELGDNRGDVMYKEHCQRNIEYIQINYNNQSAFIKWID